MTDILHKDESYKIVGACFGVYKQMGPGFTEPVYHERIANKDNRVRKGSIMEEIARTGAPNDLYLFFATFRGQGLRRCFLE